MKKNGSHAHLKLKVIPNINYEFDDVIENVEKLLDFHFPETNIEIRNEVQKLSTKFLLKIDYDYDKFMRIANHTKGFNKWSDLYQKMTEGLPRIASAVLDLYFQMKMVPSYDVYNDTLIYAYLEDIQPFLD
jgi:hypothetical protein